MVCLQLGLSNNLLSAPAKLSNGSVGAGAEENIRVFLTHWRILLHLADGEAWEIAFIQTRSSTSAPVTVSPSAVEVALPVLSLVVAAAGRTAQAREVSLHPDCVLTELGTGQKALGSALPPTATSTGLSGVLPTVSLARLSEGTSLAHA